MITYTYICYVFQKGWTLNSPEYGLGFNNIQGRKLM